MTRVPQSPVAGPDKTAAPAHRLSRLIKRLRFLPWLLFLLASSLQIVAAQNSHLADIIEQVKPSVVAVGSYYIKDVPKARFFGTGFVVGDGTKVVTNHHVVARIEEEKRLSFLRIFHPALPAGGVQADAVGRDETHDLAVLEMPSRKLPALELGDSGSVREGEKMAFTGYPIGLILGLNPSTHTGIVSAISPIVLPSPTSRAIDGELAGYLRNPYEIFQIDATAFPGNSGSPLYRIRNGEVVGVINKVFVKGKKEHLLKEPTGITYAIPGKHAEDLLQEIRR